MQNFKKESKIRKFREIFKKYFRYTYNSLNNDRPEHVLFARAPHLGMDNMIDWVARYMKIPVTICYQTIFPDLFFSARTTDNLFAMPPISNSYEELDVNVHPELFYMKTSRNFGFFERIV